jgi:hypothetical protein
MTKIKIAVQHVQTIEQEKKHKAKQSKCIHTTLFRKCERKENKQTNKLLLLLNTDNTIYIYEEKQ